MVYMLQCNSKAGNPLDGWFFLGLHSLDEGEEDLTSFSYAFPKFSFRLIPLVEGE